MRCRTIAILALTCGIAVTGAVPVAAQTTAQTAPGANLSAYRTYEWLATAPLAGSNPIIVQQIIADFDAAMASRGYQKAPAVSICSTGCE